MLRECCYLSSIQVGNFGLNYKKKGPQGAKPRFDRINSKKFGDKNYTTVELVAELGGAFLCAELGIPIIDKGNPVGYIAHWLDVLKENSRKIFTAASAASKAVAYLQGFQPK